MITTICTKCYKNHVGACADLYNFQPLTIDVSTGVVISPKPVTKTHA